MIQRLRIILLLPVLILFLSFTLSSKDNDKQTVFQKSITVNKILTGDDAHDDNRLALYFPSELTTDSKGNIYIVDRLNYRIVKLNSKGDFVLEWGGRGEGPGEFLFHKLNAHISTDRNDRIVILDNGLRRIQIFSNSGKYHGVFNLKNNKAPQSMVIDNNDNLFLSVSPSFSSNNTILHYKIIQNDLKYIKSFGKHPFSFDLRKSKGKKVVKYLPFASISLITITDDGEIFQVFRNMPFVRKYNKDYSISWEKKVEIEKLKNLTGALAEYLKQLKHPGKAKEADIESYCRASFCQSVTFDIVRERFLINMWANSTLLELDNRGYLVGCYYPQDFNELKTESSKVAPFISKIVHPTSTIHFDSYNARLLYLEMTRTNILYFNITK